MADQDRSPGRLIAVDGARGKDTHAAAQAVVDALRESGVECAVSRWDASGLFGELAATARGDRDISARTLMLVYAADLAFRLRWEIRPVLEAGGTVVASPYLETAIALGAVHGLREGWIRDLLRFAPAADLRGRAEDRKVDQPWKRRTDRGFPEFCAATLDASASKNRSTHSRRKMMRMLDQAKGRTIVTLDGKGVEALTRAATGSAKAASRRP